MQGGLEWSAFHPLQQGRRRPSPFPPRLPTLFGKERDSMNTEHVEYINRCETAFNQFVNGTPDFVNSEENNRSLIAALDRLGLTYDRASHLEIAFRQLKSKKSTTTAPAAPSVPQTESLETAVEREANRLLDSGEVTFEPVRGMSAKERERRCMSRAFALCLDLLEERRVKTCHNLAKS